MACTLAESPSDPFHRKLRQLRCLHCRFDCYRVKRTSSRAGVAPAEVQRFSRRTLSPTILTVYHFARDNPQIMGVFLDCNRHRHFRLRTQTLQLEIFRMGTLLPATSQRCREESAIGSCWNG